MTKRKMLDEETNSLMRFLGKFNKTKTKNGNCLLGVAGEMWFNWSKWGLAVGKKQSDTKIRRMAFTENDVREFSAVTGGCWRVNIYISVIALKILLQHMGAKNVTFSCKTWLCDHFACLLHFLWQIKTVVFLGIFDKRLKKEGLVFHCPWGKRG